MEYSQNDRRRILQVGKIQTIIQTIFPTRSHLPLCVSRKNTVKKKSKKQINLHKNSGFCLIDMKTYLC